MPAGKLTRRPASAKARPIAAIVLAGGEGKRFRSTTPKVLHLLCGRPMFAYVLDVLAPLQATKTVLVVGRGAEEVKAAAKQRATQKLTFALQEEQLGTGDAARVGDDALGRFAGDVLVVPIDTPLLATETVERLLAHHRATHAAATILTGHLDDPTGYGRIVRDDEGGVARVVEETDAEDDERAVREVNSSVYVFDRAPLRAALTRLDRANAQRELYLTDVIEVLREKGEPVEAFAAADAAEVLGINSRVQLAEVSKLLRERINERHMLAGVTIEDPATTFIDAQVTIGTDTVLHPLTHLHGDTSVGARAEIGPNVRLVDTEVGDGATVINAVAKEAVIGPRAQVGPFAYLRPGAMLAEGSKVGTFVEVKGSTIGPGSKVPHLSYIGDAEIGTGTNIGAGTITCNYDGETGKKSKTVIGDDVLIGSDTMLVAPVTVGTGAVTGAGAVVSRDVPPGEVAVGAPARVVRKRKPRPDTDKKAKGKGGRRT